MSRTPVVRHRWLLAVPLAASAMLLAACGGAPSATSVGEVASSPGSVIASATAAPPSTTPQALDFTGTNVVDGAAFEGAALAGTPVVMWFWAPWCTVCRAESPDVAKVAAEFKGRVTFVGIAGRGPLQDMRSFVSETGTGGFTHVADVDGSLWSRFGVVAQPSFVFVTSSGEAQSFTGGLGENDLRDVANQLLVS